MINKCVYFAGEVFIVVVGGGSCFVFNPQIDDQEMLK